MYNIIYNNIASWAVVSTEFSFRWMFFVTLSIFPSNKVSIMPSSLNLVLSKSLISSKRSLLVDACYSFVFLDVIDSL